MGKLARQFRRMLLTTGQAPELTPALLAPVLEMYAREAMAGVEAQEEAFPLAAIAEEASGSGSSPTSPQRTKMNATRDRFKSASKESLAVASVAGTEDEGEASPCQLPSPAACSSRAFPSRRPSIRTHVGSPRVRRLIEDYSMTPVPETPREGSPVPSVASIHLQAADVAVPVARVPGESSRPLPRPVKNKRLPAPLPAEVSAVDMEKAHTPRAARNGVDLPLEPPVSRTRAPSQHPVWPGRRFRAEVLPRPPHGRAAMPSSTAARVVTSAPPKSTRGEMRPAKVRRMPEKPAVSQRRKPASASDTTHIVVAGPTEKVQLLEGLQRPRHPTPERERNSDGGELVSGRSSPSLVDGNRNRSSILSTMSAGACPGSCSVPRIMVTTPVSGCPVEPTGASPQQEEFPRLSSLAVETESNSQVADGTEEHGHEPSKAASEVEVSAPPPEEHGEAVPLTSSPSDIGDLAAAVQEIIPPREQSPFASMVRRISLEAAESQPWLVPAPHEVAPR
eukprot:CAMPEP_0178376000 /NCGR_PEP_ID=MMETSP0689_2-20121128/3178_1 /TAXON_ID=160604 /ORGANISM="Amphidinium massartii, Strain CS-259" /LENGTH=506 /DNA_ID=CAMNT_0019996011 /DNA_START=60 /DNA_END=1580 /DNA_ORIENTATION=+